MLRPERNTPPIITVESLSAVPSLPHEDHNEAIDDGSNRGAAAFSADTKQIASSMRPVLFETKSHSGEEQIRVILPSQVFPVQSRDELQRVLTDIRRRREVGELPKESVLWVDVTLPNREMGMWSSLSVVNSASMMGSNAILDTAVQNEPLFGCKGDVQSSGEHATLQWVSDVFGLHPLTLGSVALACCMHADELFCCV